ncbi:hypothetical protein M2271_003925 [Streptomyces sp. LBL]|nr:hypothetical protein [Streptomyces sp. LBL]
MAGGASVRSASWATDAAFLYIGAYSVVAPRRSAERGPDGSPAARDQVVERLKMLPKDLFPITTASAEEPNSGEGHDRFDYTLRLLFGGSPNTARDRPHECLFLNSTSVAGRWAS